MCFSSFCSEKYIRSVFHLPSHQSDSVAQFLISAKHPGFSLIQFQIILEDVGNQRVRERKLRISCGPSSEAQGKTLISLFYEERVKKNMVHKELYWKD